MKEKIKIFSAVFWVLLRSVWYSVRSEYWTRRAARATIKFEAEQEKIRNMFLRGER